MAIEEVKSLVFRYFNHRRICSAIGGIPPMKKRKLFFDQQQNALVA